MPPAGDARGAATTATNIPLQAPSGGATRWPGLAPLRVETFRLLWTGTLFTQTAAFMEQAAHGWLIYQLTDSPVWVGLVSGARGLPMLLVSIPGGALVDRLDHKKVLLTCQITMFLVAAVQVVLLFTGLLQPWHILVAAFMSGTSISVLFPTRQSIIPTVIPRESLPTAMAVHTAGQNTTRVLGPSLAGMVLGAAGATASFGVQMLIAGSALWSTAQLRLAPVAARTVRTSILQDMVEALRYVAGDQQLRWQLLLATIPVLFALPFTQLMPIFARDILGVGPEGLGLLLSAHGGGAVVGAVVLANLNPQQRGRLLLGSAGLMGVLVTLFAFSTHIVLSVLLIACVGISQAVYMATNAALFQLATPDRLRGRVMAMYIATWSFFPLGTIPQSALADVIGAPLAVGLAGGLCSSFILLIALRSPFLRRL